MVLVLVGPLLLLVRPLPPPLPLPTTRPCFKGRGMQGVTAALSPIVETAFNVWQYLSYVRPRLLGSYKYKFAVHTLP